jgi:NADPH:quinone reductase-like Zn-dependent oxidoreductase/NAD(P)-dependent dehydrogenase (short-subunit alcohol dehydrogenase family)
LDCNPESFVCEPNLYQFEGMKKVAATAAGILWVVRGANLSSENPTANLATGFARTIRSEYGNTRIAVLDLDATTSLDLDTATDTIARTFAKLFQGPEASDLGLELEMAERGGNIMIPRLIEDREANRVINGLLSGNQLESCPFEQQGRPLRMEVGTPGMLDTIHFVDDTRTINEWLTPDNVEVKVYATGVNFKDVMMALGQIDYETPGLDYSGVVTRIGSRVENVAVGDRVAGYSFGTFANQIHDRGSAVQKIPDDMSFDVAAALPVVYSTAYYSIHYIARLSKHDTILVHAASGGLDQAIIELSRHIGAEIFATVGSLEKKEFLMSRFGMPSDHILFSRDGSFHKDLLRMTDGKGVDVIMNSVAGEMLRLTWQCIASFGRFVELGSRDYTINSRLEMAPFARNVTFAAVNLVGLRRERPQIAANVWSDVMDLFRAKQAQPPSPIVTYGISEVETVLRTMQTGKHMGKLVIVPQPGERVRVVPRSDESLFQVDSSYMLVGGLGGLGRAVAEWMVDCGARNLIFLSRSGLRSSAAQETVKQVEAKGVRVLVQECDISDVSHVSRSIQAAKDMPPIRGVIQGAMVLRDSLFENLSLADHNAVIQPKVHGTWHLHEMLPKDLDFFLMLSSTCGAVGNASQAPYAASSTFLDSFAQYRRSLGLQATTIDLGIILEVGYVAENAELARNLERQGFAGTTKKELLAIISTAIRRKEGASHLVTGLGTWQEDSLIAFNEPIFSHFRHSSSRHIDQGNNKSTQGSASRLRDKLRHVANADEATEQVCSGIISKVSALSMISADEIDSSQTLSSYGVDSLVAVEMRNWIFKEIDVSVTILELLSNEPLAMFAQKMAQRSKLFDFSALS